MLPAALKKVPRLLFQLSDLSKAARPATGSRQSISYPWPTPTGSPHTCKTVPVHKRTDTLFGCHDLACFLRRNIFHQNAIFYQVDQTVLRLLIKLLRHVRRIAHLLKRNKTWGTSQCKTQLPYDPLQIARQCNFGLDQLAKVTDLEPEDLNAADNETGRPGRYDKAIGGAANTTSASEKALSDIRSVSTDDTPRDAS